MTVWCYILVWMTPRPHLPLPTSPIVLSSHPLTLPHLLTPPSPRVQPPPCSRRACLCAPTIYDWPGRFVFDTASHFHPVTIFIVTGRGVRPCVRLWGGCGWGVGRVALLVLIWQPQRGTRPCLWVVVCSWQSGDLSLARVCMCVYVCVCVPACNMHTHEPPNIPPPG